MCTRIAKYTLLIAIALMAFPAVTAWADGEAVVSKADLSDMSLEELMQMEVTSVARDSRTLWGSAAAVYVVTQEEIRRSGVTTIADALRMVPGMHVASINSHMWAITSRGFNDRFANKMLVLIDGRSVYTPLFSGTWWDVQDTLLEDIERIEVIRGPGATMWGANAVNGVINIITKRADEGPGLLMSYDSGSVNKSMAGLRYSGTMGDKGKYRVYAKHFDHDSFVDASGQDADDTWKQSRAGFRMDQTLSETDSLTVQGDIYDGDGSQRFRGNLYTAPYEELVVDDYTYSGSNMLARWTRSPSPDSETVVQMYCDRTKRDDIQNNETRNTWDLDFQNRRAIGDRRVLMWGLGYRITNDSTGASPLSQFTPTSGSDHLLTAFVQEDRYLIKDKLCLTYGTKLEHNGYTGYEVQPSARLMWQPDDKQVLWSAVSRAVRTPTRGEREGIATLRILPPNGTPFPMALTFIPSPDFDSEDVTSYELGYRVQPSENLNLDVAAFYNDYDNLRTFTMGTPYPVMDPAPHLIVPYTWTNLGHAWSQGYEIAANWQPADTWRLALAYSHLSIRTGIAQTPEPSIFNEYERHTPPHMYTVRSYLDLPRNMELDAAMYILGPVPAHNVPGYTRFDVRLGWQRPDGLSVSLAVQNLFDNRHPEFGGTLSEIPVEVPRTAYLKVTKTY